MSVLSITYSFLWATTVSTFIDCFFIETAAVYGRRPIRRIYWLDQIVESAFLRPIFMCNCWILLGNTAMHVQSTGYWGCVLGIKIMKRRFFMSTLLKLTPLNRR